MEKETTAEGALINVPKIILKWMEICSARLKVPERLTADLSE